MDAEEHEELMEQYMQDGYVTCPECGNNIEVDCEECLCGWKNAIFI